MTLPDLIVDSIKTDLIVEVEFMIMHHLSAVQFIL